MKFTFNRQISIENVIAVAGIIVMIAIDHHRLGETESRLTVMESASNAQRELINIAAIKMERVSTILENVQLTATPKER